VNEGLKQIQCQGHSGLKSNYKDAKRFAGGGKL